MFPLPASGREMFVGLPRFLFFGDPGTGVNPSSSVSLASRPGADWNTPGVVLKPTPVFPPGLETELVAVPDKEGQETSEPATTNCRGRCL